MRLIKGELEETFNDSLDVRIGSYGIIINNMVHTFRNVRGLTRYATIKPKKPSTPD